MNGCSFQQGFGKVWVDSCLNTGKHFFLDVYLKANSESIVSSKNGTRDFQNSPPFERQHVFVWQSRKILNVFNTLTLTQIFWKTKTFFKKLEYHFLVESTKIESASFPYKTAISEANAKTNRIMTTKWAYRKKFFDSNSFILFF